MMERSILFVTGTRADFGKLEPLALKCRDAGFNVSFFVTGMHMLKQYGLTKIEVHRLKNVHVHEFMNSRSDDPQDLILAKTVIGFSDFCREHKPDLVVIHGDRVEALACSMVCAMNYIRSAHIEGGEVSGTIDELFRHCNSKLANHHFVSSKEAMARVMSLGEDKKTIYVIGSPELDFHSKSSGIKLDDVKKRYNIPFEDYGVVLFHPVTSEVDTIGDQAQSLYEELKASNKSFVVISPNNDPGAKKIISALDILDKHKFRIIPSMRFAHFSELIRNASAIIGNSSAGVREAPFLGIPSLNIGTRQTNRSNAPSIVNASAFDHHGISNFLNNSWGTRFKTHRAFGVGGAANRFLTIIKDEDFWSGHLQKVFKDYKK